MLLTACNQINAPAFMSDYDARLRAALTVPDDLALGVDLGTTSLSVQLLSLDDGRSVFRYSREHRAILDRGEFAYDARMLLSAAIYAVSRAASLCPKLKAIGLTGLMHGIVCVDETLEPLSPLYSWQNSFGELSLDSGVTLRDKARELTGFDTPSGYGLLTAYALRRLGRLNVRTARIATIPDLATAWLANYDALSVHHGKPYSSCGLDSSCKSDSNCGFNSSCKPELVVDPTMAASLGYYDLAAHSFGDAPARLGLPYDITGRVASDREIIGYFRGIPIAAAIGDNQAGVYAATTGNIPLISIGTSGQVSVVSDTSESRGEVRPYFDGKFLHTGATLCAGSAYASLVDFISEAVTSLGYSPDRAAIYDYLNHAAESGSHGLTADTCFCGTRVDGSRRGDIRGIALDNFHPGALASAILHGIVDELYALYSSLNDSRPDCIVGAGNALRRNKLLRRICSERFGLPLMLPVNVEEAACGAALRAAVVSGCIGQDELPRLIAYQSDD